MTLSLRDAGSTVQSMSGSITESVADSLTGLASEARETLEGLAHPHRRRSRSRRFPLLALMILVVVGAAVLGATRKRASAPAAPPEVDASGDGIGDELVVDDDASDAPSGRGRSAG